MSHMHLINSEGYVNKVPYSGMTGRFNGISAKDRPNIDDYAYHVELVLCKPVLGEDAMSRDK